MRPCKRYMTQVFSDRFSYLNDVAALYDGDQKNWILIEIEKLKHPKDVLRPVLDARKKDVVIRSNTKTKSPTDPVILRARRCARKEKYRRSRGIPKRSLPMSKDERLTRRRIYIKKRRSLGLLKKYSQKRSLNYYRNNYAKKRETYLIKAKEYRNKIIFIDGIPTTKHKFNQLRSKHGEFAKVRLAINWLKNQMNKGVQNVS